MCERACRSRLRRRLLGAETDAVADKVLSMQIGRHDLLRKTRVQVRSVSKICDHTDDGGRFDEWLETAIHPSLQSA